MAPLFPRGPRARGPRACGPWACGPWARSLAAALVLASLPLLPNRALSQQATADPSTTPTLGQAINPSNGAQLELVRLLRERGALYYGAWWCPACFRQKNLFGQEAGNQLPYVECEKTAADRQRCDRAGIKAYPTWVLGDRRVEGILSLDALGRLLGDPPKRPAP